MAVSGRQGNLAHSGRLVHSTVSVMCSQERRRRRQRLGGGKKQACLLPTHCRPSGPTHRGEGHVKRQKKRRRRRRKKKTGTDCQIGVWLFLSWTCLTIALPSLCSSSPPSLPPSLGSQHSHTFRFHISGYLPNTHTASSPSRNSHM